MELTLLDFFFFTIIQLVIYLQKKYLKKALKKERKLNDEHCLKIRENKELSVLFSDTKEKNL